MAIAVPPGCDFFFLNPRPSSASPFHFLHTRLMERTSMSCDVHDKVGWGKWVPVAMARLRSPLRRPRFPVQAGRSSLSSLARIDILRD